MHPLSFSGLFESHGYGEPQEHTHNTYHAHLCRMHQVEEPHISLVYIRPVTFNPVIPALSFSTKRSVHYAATDLHSSSEGGAKRPTSLISPTKSQLPSPRHTQPLPVPTSQPSAKPLPSPGSLLPMPKPSTKPGSNAKHPQQQQAQHQNPQSYRYAAFSPQGKRLSVACSFLFNFLIGPNN